MTPRRFGCFELLSRTTVALVCGLTLAFFALPIDAQSIVTYAGGGPVGDGKPATEALLNLPNDVTSDSDGNYYIADSLNNRIRTKRGL